MNIDIKMINSMIDDLQRYKNLKKDDIMLQAVRLRLDESYKNYDHELNNILLYLKQKESLNVLKKLNRMNNKWTS